VLISQYASTKSFFGVAVFYGNDGLENDWAGIQIFIHEMHRASREFYSVIQRLLLRFEAGNEGKATDGC